VLGGVWDADALAAELSKSSNRHVRCVPAVLLKLAHAPELGKEPCSVLLRFKVWAVLCHGPHFHCLRESRARLASSRVGVCGRTAGGSAASW
jgi:hypothetical protein